MKFSKHFRMKEDDIIDFVKEKTNYFRKSDVLFAKEIGDGNINYVYRVRDPKTGRGMVVKQADTLLRSSKRPLDVRRNRLEAEYFQYCNTLSPSFFPTVYAYDDAMSALILEDISEYQNMRKVLLEGKIFPKFSTWISTFFTDVLLQTTELFLDRAKKRKMAAEFLNVDLCDISEDLVFTEPYYDYKKRNVISNNLLDFVRKKLYENEELKAQVGELRFQFLNQAEALLHGDLHTGSLFIHERGIKIIDPEFAFYGPLGYDIGNVIANLFFPLVKAFFQEGRKEFIIWLKRTIEEIFDMVRSLFKEKMEKNVSFPLYNKGFQTHFLNHILTDSLGFAGTEIIRRVVGDAKVPELTEMEDSIPKDKVEKILLEMGIFLILHRREINKGRKMIENLERLVHFYGMDGETR